METELDGRDAKFDIINLVLSLFFPTVLFVMLIVPWVLFGLLAPMRVRGWTMTLELNVTLERKASKC